MSLPQVYPSFCIFCYKPVKVPVGSQCFDTGKFQFKNFISFIQKYIEKKNDILKGEKLLKTNYTSDLLKSCPDCDIIIESFCEIYEQIESLELQFNLKLNQLKDVVELSSRIPSRLAKVNKALQLRFPDDLKRIDENRADLQAIRQTIIATVNQRESTAVPAVTEKRHSGTTKTSKSKNVTFSSNHFEDTNNTETSYESGPTFQIKLENPDSPESPDNFSDQFFNDHESSNDSNTNLPEPSSSSSQLNPSNGHDHITCEICKQKILYRRKHYHYEMCHDLTKVSAEEGVWTCDIDNCTAYFLNKRQLLAHKNKHDTQGKLGKCSIEYINSKKYFQCKSCKTSFDNLKYFRRHLSSTSCGIELEKKEKGSTATVKQNKCPNCEETFNKKEKLWIHQNEVHSKGKNKYCPKCGKCFSRTWSYKIHMEYHKGSANWKWACIKCEKKFATVHQLKRHAESHLKGTITSGCAIGESETRNVDSEDTTDIKPAENLTLVYEEEDVNICKTCGVKWEHDEELWKHRREAHCKNVCLICGKEFSGKARVKLHMECHKDPEEWKWECKECGRRFDRESRLNDHMITHSNEKPFKCECCGDRFPYRFSWCRHLKKVHGKVVDRKDNSGRVLGEKEGTRKKLKKSTK